MLEVAGNHMDMLESVLVRVEELLEHWILQYNYVNIIKFHYYINYMYF